MPHIEAIEPRTMFTITTGTATVDETFSPVVPTSRNPAVQAISLTKSGTLFVHGTSDRDRIAIKQTGGDITVFNNGTLIASTGYGDTGDGYDASLVKRINISAAGGRDLITAQIAPRIKLSLADSTRTDVLTRYTLDGARMDDDKHSVIG